MIFWGDAAADIMNETVFETNMTAALDGGDGKQDMDSSDSTTMPLKNPPHRCDMDEYQARTNSLHCPNWYFQ